MRVTALLWDGFNKISGFLEVGEKCLKFEMADFEKSSLKLNIPYEDIIQIKLYHIFTNVANGISIVEAKGKRNIFILDQAVDIKRIIENNINKFREDN